jgi:hypothetical protein
MEWRSGDREAAEREARAALEGLIALGLPYRWTGERRFDPVEVSNFVNWASPNLGDPTRSTHNVPSARWLIFETHGVRGPDIAAPNLRALGAGRYRVALRRTFNLAGRNPKKRVRLRLPTPLDDAGLCDLQIEHLLPEHGVFETRSEPGRLEILANIPPEGQITVGMRATFTAYPSPSPGAPEQLCAADVELYTRPVEGVVRVTERIRALADRLAGDETDREKIIACFWAFIMDRLSICAIHHDLLEPTTPLETVLDRGFANCLLGSALAVGLCRARGIPARIVTGYLLHASAPSYHTWFEIWVDGRGWQPFDLLGWSLTDDHRHSNDWRDYYYGQLDHRMVVERPPRLFVGSGDVRLPPRWHMVTYPHGAGTMIEFRSMDSGAFVYREHIVVERLEEPNLAVTPGEFGCSG